MKIEQFERDGQLWFNVDGKEMPLYLEDGELNQELQDILNQEKENQGDKIVVVAEPEKFAKTKMVLKKNKRRIIAGGLALVILTGGIILLCKSCKSDKQKKYDYNSFYKNAITSTMAEFEKAGYPITEDQARDLVYGMNAEEAIETGHINKDTNDVELFDNCLAYAGKILSQHCDAVEKYLYSDECGKGKVKDISVAALVAQDYNDYDYQVIAKLESYQKELEKMILKEKGFYRCVIDESDKARFDEIMLEIRNFWTCSGGIKIKDGEKLVNVTLHDIGEGDKIMAASTIIYKITYLTKNIDESIIYTDLAGNDVVLHVKDIVKTLEEAPAIYDTAELSNKLAHAANGGVSEKCEKKVKVKTK